MSRKQPDMEEQPESIKERVLELTRKHHEWRGSCINLIASENITSLPVREMLASDFAHRYAEGEPYKRNYCGSKYIDEIEVLTVNLAKKLFKAEHVNVKPISGSQANLAVFYALTSPGESIMSLHVPNGGHISYMEFGGAGVRGIKVEKIPFDQKEMNIDVDGLFKSIKEKKPSLVLLGGSVILFPQPVKEAREAVNEFGGYLGYDASHVLGLIAGGQFQDPVGDGADIVPSSTHKTFPGPQGGIILCKKSLSKRVDLAMFPGLTSNHHLHRLAGLAIALAEMEKYGQEYAKQMVKNAKALAEELYSMGFSVLCEHKGFTESHQVLMDVSKLGGGSSVSKLLERANIICNKNLLPWDKIGKADNPSGVRLGTSEVTRLGLKEREMRQVADYIKKVIIDKKKPEQVALEVKDFIKNFNVIKYTFTSSDEAYKYLSL